MTVETTQRAELLRKLNTAFDAQRARLGFTNDEDFARHLGVSPKTLSFWRTGRWPRADAALISALLPEPQFAA
jgi:DNA-binding transcriptional regulator YiaG